MKYFAKLLLSGFAATIYLASGSLMAQTTSGQAAPAAAAGGEMSEATVRKVDKEQGKVTLKHGEIKNLDMPPMTMVFTVKDKAMLDKVNAGDKVRFKAANENGKITVLEMAVQK